MWPDDRETQDLLRRANADAAAANELWECYRPALRRMIGLRLDRAISRRVDASDVVQDVLFKASQRLADYLRNPSMPFHLWLRQIARDHVIDAHRRHRQAGKRSLDREQPLPGMGPRGFPGDQSSLGLAEQLKDPALTPAAECFVASSNRGSTRPCSDWRTTIARSSCSATSSSSPISKLRKCSA